jgi:hypothetical protein
VAVSEGGYAVRSRTSAQRNGTHPCSYSHGLLRPQLQLTCRNRAASRAPQNPRLPSEAHTHVRVVDANAELAVLARLPVGAQLAPVTLCCLAGNVKA